MFAKRRNINKIIRSISKGKSSLVISITKTELEMHFIVIIIKSNIYLPNIHFLQGPVLPSFLSQLQLCPQSLKSVMPQHKTNMHFCIQPGFLRPVTTVSHKHYHITLLCSYHSYQIS